MQERYPFFEFVWKGPEARGHPASMKILARMVTTPFMLHVEDDRVLVDKRHYFRDMLDILDYDSSLGQVVFNDNYSETAQDVIKGGEARTTEGGVDYKEHTYCTTEEEKRVWREKHGDVSNCSYYPHFSLSPSLIRTAIFDKVAFEDEPCFEFRFALRYVQAGYKTAFLHGHHFKHIGRLTSDRHTTKPNAYDLLNTTQFVEPVAYKSFLVNLDRRPDRLERVMRLAKFLPDGITRVRACDGQDLIKTPALYSLCKRCDYGMRPGVIGCALSHLRLYKNLLVEQDVQGYLIFEDDVTPTAALRPKITRVLTSLQSSGEAFDVVFFSSILRPGQPQRTTETVVRKHNRQEIDEFTIGGTGCYYISKRGAKAVFDYILKNTLDVAIDALLFNIASQTNVFFVLPPIVSQVDTPACTDVQHDHHSVSPLLDADMIEQASDITPEDLDNIFDNLLFRTKKKRGHNLSLGWVPAAEY
jgi:GR25 family glycosyltransferase involved in LPS biosynthesis